MADFSPKTSTGTLYLKGLKTPVKTQRFAKWMYKKNEQNKAKPTDKQK